MTPPTHLYPHVLQLVDLAHPLASLNWDEDGVCAVPRHVMLHSTAVFLRDRLYVAASVDIRRSGDFGPKIFTITRDLASWSLLQPPTNLESF